MENKPFEYFEVKGLGDVSDLEALWATTPARSPDEQALRDWLAFNRANFTSLVRNNETKELERKWRAVDIAELAIFLKVCDSKTAYAILSDGDYALKASLPEQRYGMQNVRETYTKDFVIPHVAVRTPLLPQWRLLSWYYKYGTEFKREDEPYVAVA